MHSLRNFSEHVSSLHQLDTFYGDETLRSLIQHSKDLVEDLKKFEDIYTLMEDEPQDGEKEEAE